VKGSVAKHDNPVHNQLPGTIKFQSLPRKEGEVTGGTSGKVKINGKEAAVVGSTVTTCNDIGMRENSVIMAPGAGMPMPVIINPKNRDEYKQEREKENTKKPEIRSVRWGKGKAKEGEEVEISAQVKDIEDGNVVTFQVWKEGQDPSAHVAQTQVTAVIEGGEAKGEWKSPLTSNDETPPEQDPKYFFTAHSAWCPFVKSGDLTVELKRPELKELKWVDKEGKETDKGLVGEALKLEASCNADTEEGAGVIFRVYKEGADIKRDKPEYETQGTNREGKAEAGWVPAETREQGDKTELKYFFTVTTPRAEIIKSGPVSVKNPQVLEMKWEPEAIYYGDEVKLLVKTFEVADFSPEIMLKIVERQKKICVHEENVNAAKDEIEIHLEIEFTEETADMLAGERQITLFAEFDSNIPIKNSVEAPLWLGTRNLLS
jgi:hypothetical protein